MLPLSYDAFEELGSKHVAARISASDRGCHTPRKKRRTMPNRTASCYASPRPVFTPVTAVSSVGISEGTALQQEAFYLRHILPTYSLVCSMLYEHTISKG